MKIVLAGAFGNLGTEIMKKLIADGHDVIAAGRTEKNIPELKGKYTFFQIDVMKPDTICGLCDGADVVISTVGLTHASTGMTAYDVDYKGNQAILNEARRAGVKKFNYISCIACDTEDAKHVPMLDAKRKLELELMASGMEYVIYRPTGYFYDILKVFRPYIEKGEMQLLRGLGGIRANVVDCPDFACFIAGHMTDTNRIYEVGGKETYTYEEMAKLCFDAAGKPTVIKYVPAFMFDILAKLPKIRKEGKRDIILFSKFTLSHDLVGKDKTGEASFAEYIRKCFAR